MNIIKIHLKKSIKYKICLSSTLVLNIGVNLFILTNVHF